MSAIRHECLVAPASLVAALALCATGCTAHDGRHGATSPVVSKATVRLEADRTGLTRLGGREMADGTLMGPGGDNAASRTLLLGTSDISRYSPQLSESADGKGAWVVVSTVSIPNTDRRNLAAVGCLLRKPGVSDVLLDGIHCYPSPRCVRAANALEPGGVL
jgi:hypothetical protein